MTRRLYYTDAYLRDFEARVLDRTGDGRRVYLDHTAFYPTSGGQPCDAGRLGSAEVIDVVDEGERIAHLLDQPLVEDRVTGHIDWTRRFDHMQQHTGQHLLSAVVAELFGHPTVGVHFGRDSATLDLDTGALSPDQVMLAEARANAVVAENRPVSVGFEDAAAAAGLRKATGRSGSIRIVSIQNLDRSACGGTHVRATGEIGAILVRKMERVKQQVRLEFVCGGRAVRQARADRDLLTRIAALYPAAPEEVPALIVAQRSELKGALAVRRELEEQVSGYRARELYSSALPTGRGIRVVELREERGPIERLRPLGQALAAFPKTLFIGTVSDPPGILLATSEDSGVDAGRALRTALAVVGGRGGGTAGMAQGSVQNGGSLTTVVANLREAAT